MPFRSLITLDRAEKARAAEMGRSPHAGPAGGEAAPGDGGADDVPLLRAVGQGHVPGPGA